MKRFQKILVAVDVAAPEFGRGEIAPVEVQTAVRAATWVHEQSGGEVTLMAVIPEPRSNEREELLGLARQRLEEDVLPYLKGVENVRLEVDAGVASVRIIQEVLRHDIDIVIVGSRKSSLVHRTIVGSQAMQLLRKCPCPVFVAPRRPVGGDVVVLTAVGMIEMTPEVLQLSAELVKARGAEWHVFHCPEYAEEGGMRLRGASIEETETYEAGEREKAWTKLHELCDPLVEVAGVKPKLWMSDGLPSEQIALAARQLDANLIVMGTIGRTGLPGMLIGNTADKIFNTVECPVLAVKPKDFVSPVTLD